MPASQELLIDLFEHADALPANWRREAMKDKRLAPLTPTIDKLAIDLKQVVMQEMRKGNASTSKDIASQEEAHTIDASQIKANDHWAARRQASDRYHREAELGRQIAAQFNPHYHN